MNNKQKAEIYFKLLAGWAANVSRIISEDELSLYAKEFEHDTKAHSARLKEMAELLLNEATE